MKGAPPEVFFHENQKPNASAREKIGFFHPWISYRIFHYKQEEQYK